MLGARRGMDDSQGYGARLVLVASAVWSVAMAQEDQSRLHVLSRVPDESRGDMVPQRVEISTISDSPTSGGDIERVLPLQRSVGRIPTGATISHMTLAHTKNRRCGAVQSATI
jgi:hypothetical protein